MELSKKECEAIISFAKLVMKDRPSLFILRETHPFIELVQRIDATGKTLSAPTPEPTLTEVQEYWAEREKAMDKREARIKAWQTATKKSCTQLGRAVANIHKIRLED